MAIWNRKSASSDSSPHLSDPEYGEKNVRTGVVHSADIQTDADGVAIHSDHAHLHRGLKSRHITMIAIGGAIGTGLIIGTGKALAQSGYVSCQNNMSTLLMFQSWLHSHCLHFCWSPRLRRHDSSRRNGCLDSALVWFRWLRYSLL